MYVCGCAKNSPVSKTNAGVFFLRWFLVSRDSKQVTPSGDHSFPVGDHSFPVISTDISPRQMRPMFSVSCHVQRRVFPLPVHHLPPWWLKTS